MATLILNPGVIYNPSPPGLTASVQNKIVLVGRERLYLLVNDRSASYRAATMCGHEHNGSYRAYPSCNQHGGGQSRIHEPSCKKKENRVRIQNNT